MNGHYDQKLNDEKTNVLNLLVFVLFLLVYILLVFVLSLLVFILLVFVLSLLVFLDFGD